MFRRCSLVFALVLMAVCVGCRTQQPAGAEQHARNTPRRDLSLDEARGGHTLKRHVAQTDEELRERLQQEPNISAASTYTDRQTAERVVGTAIQNNRMKIQRWMERGPRRPNLVIDYTEPNDAIGREMHRRSAGSVPCDHAIAVLRADVRSDFYVLTSYPECRP
jgi:Bacterial CdiA-CT RNAse A domain